LKKRESDAYRVFDRKSTKHHHSTGGAGFGCTSASDSFLFSASRHPTLVASSSSSIRFSSPRNLESLVPESNSSDSDVDDAVSEASQSSGSSNSSAHAYSWTSDSSSSERTLSPPPGRSDLHRLCYAIRRPGLLQRLMSAIANLWVAV
jgi:hypothetical protein